MPKKKVSIETSSFRSECLAMKSCTEYIQGLKFKLHMMGIQYNCPAFIYGDSQHVLSNKNMPQLMPTKKSNSILYHSVREGTARNEWKATYINTNDKRSNLLTNPLPHGEKRTKSCKMLLHRI